MVTLWRLLYFVGIHSTAISFSGDYYLHNYFTSCLFTMGNTGSTRCLQTCTCRYTHSVRSGIVFLTWDKVLNDNQTYTQNKKSIGFHNWDSVMEVKHFDSIMQSWECSISVTWGMHTCYKYVYCMCGPFH